MQLREQLDVQGQGQHGPGAFAEHGPGHVVRLGQKRLAGGHLCPSQVLNPSEQGLMLKFLVTKAPQGFQGDLLPQPGLATEFSHFGVDEALNSPKDVGIGPPLSRYGVLIISVCSAFSLLRILSTRVAALSCLECTSPAPTRLDENRTVSGPFPDHVFAPSLVPAQQRWQNHPGSKVIFEKDITIHMQTG
jgi:hypothetical protein